MFYQPRTQALYLRPGCGWSREPPDFLNLNLNLI